MKSLVKKQNQQRIIPREFVRHFQSPDEIKAKHENRKQETTVSNLSRLSKWVSDFHFHQLTFVTFPYLMPNPTSVILRKTGTTNASKKNKTRIVYSLFPCRVESQVTTDKLGT